jgi:hypothetical protein
MARFDSPALAGSPLGLAAVCALVLQTSCFSRRIELIGAGAVAGNASDGLSLVPAILEDGTPHDRLGGFGSGIAYTGIGTRYVATPDRGPSGKTSYVNRYYVFDIAVQLGGQVDIRLVAARTLSNRLGKTFVGTETAFDPTDRDANRALDPEAIRVSGRGTFFLSDEYGPAIVEFDAQGKELRTLPVPKRFLAGRSSGKGADGASRATPEEATGRQPKCGMEGLAVSPDGTKVYAIMQSPLFQDHALDQHNEPFGLNNRIVEIDLTTNKTREFVYSLEAKKNGVSEMVAVSADQFLVLERDMEGSSLTAIAKIFKIDLASATDVSGVERLPPRGLPPGVRPVAKRLFVDLRDRRFVSNDPACPAKAEGLTFGPDLSDGRHLLLVSCDNDFSASVDTKIMAFALDPASIPGFHRQVSLREVEVGAAVEGSGSPSRDRGN